MTCRLWLLRDAWRNESSFLGTEPQAAAEAQLQATARGVVVTYRAALETQFVFSEAPTARMKRP